MLFPVTNLRNREAERSRKILLREFCCVPNSADINVRWDKDTRRLSLTSRDGQGLTCGPE